MKNELDTVTASLKAAEITGNVSQYVKDILNTGLSEAQLGAICAVSQQAVNQWKHGQSRPVAFNLIALYEMAKGLRSQK